MAIDNALSAENKKNLDEARRMLGFKSRNALIAWFADNAVKIANAEVQKAGGRLAYLGLEEKDD